MASNETPSAPPPAGPSGSNTAADLDEQQSQLPPQSDVLPSTTPVELSHLSQHPPQSQPTTDVSSASATAAAAPTAASGVSHTAEAPSPVLALDGAYIPAPPPEPAEDSMARPDLSLRGRAKSEAIGPSVEDNPGASSKILQTPADGGPAVLITLMLLSGARHPYKIDQRYLRKRNIIKDGEEDIDPFSISVYTLKELIWRDWRDEWDPRPTNPTAIRLISFGKLLDDKQTLKDTKFNATNPNVVHMTVRPQEFLDEDENQKGGKAASSRGGMRGDDEGTGAGCCRCSVM